MSNLKATVQSSNLKSSDTKVRAYKLSLSVIEYARKIPDNRLNSIFINQLVRAVTSVGANLIEAKASSSKRDFIKFVEISLKSANESKYWFCLLRDSGIGNKEQTERLISETSEIANMLGSSLLTLKGKKI